MDCSSPSSSVHGIPRQEYRSGLPFSSPGHLPDRDRTRISCIGRHILYPWATMEALVPFFKRRNLKILVRQSEEMRLLDFCGFSHLFTVVSATLTSTTVISSEFPSSSFWKEFGFQKELSFGTLIALCLSIYCFPQLKVTPVKAGPYLSCWLYPWSLWPCL